MKLLAKKRKTHRDGQHYYFGELGENPHGISYVYAETAEELGTDPRHYSKAGTKYFLVLRGQLEVEVKGELVAVDSERVLMIEPMEIHRVVRMIQSPCEFIVFGTVKDPTGADRVVVEG